MSNIAGCAKYLREAKELRSRVCWEHHSAMGALFGIIRQLFCSPCLLASYLDENILPTQSEDQGWQYRQFEAKRCGFEECWKRRAAWEPGFESSFANFLLPPPSMRSVLETSFDWLGILASEQPNSLDLNLIRLNLIGRLSSFLNFSF